MKTLWILAITLILTILFLFITWANLEHRRVMTEAEKAAHFERIRARGFSTGDEGNRCWITVRDTRGKQELWTGKEWVKL